MRRGFEQLQGFQERDALKDAEPFARMPVVGQVESIPANVFKACERCLEFRLIRIEFVGPVAGDKAIFVAVPLPVDGDRIIELWGRVLGRKRGLSTSAMNFSHAVVITDFSPAGGLFPARPPM